MKQKNENVVPQYTNFAYTIWQNPNDLTWNLLKVDVDPVSKLAGNVQIVRTDTHQSTIFEQMKIEIALLLENN